jgi:hypothetical protein
MDFERSKIIKDSAVMPGLNLSPFLSLSQQAQNSHFGAEFSMGVSQKSLFESRALNQDLATNSEHTDSV